MTAKVKGYRVMVGLTQQELASKLGISVQSYRNKEKGRVAFKDSEKIFIRELFGRVVKGITLEDLFFFS